MRAMAQTRLSDVDRIVLKAIVSSTDGTLFGQKKLQKLLFIAHFPRAFEIETKRPLRALRFKIFKYGPFAAEIYASISRLVDAGLIVREDRDLARTPSEPSFPDAEDEDARPSRIVVFHANKGSEEELSGADESDLALVGKVVKRWGWLTSDQIEELVCDRTGLDPDLKGRYQSVAWEDFARRAPEGTAEVRPTVPDEYWRSEQAFLKERGALLKAHGEGKFAAYLAERRVAIGTDQVQLYEMVLRETGHPPDYIGYLSETGRQFVDAFVAAGA